MQNLSVPAFLFSLLLLSSCVKENTLAPPTPTLSVSTTNISLSGSKSGIDSFTVNYTGSWTVSIEPSNTSWLKLSRTSGTGKMQVIVSADQTNLTGASRVANIVVKPDNNTNIANVTVNQTIYTTGFFSRVFGGSELDRFSASVATSDGGFISVGFAQSNDYDIIEAKGRRDALVVRFDIEGNVVWKRNFGGTDDDEVNSIVPTRDGNFIVVGRTASTTGDFPPTKGNFDLLIMKIDGNGNKIWSKTYGGSADDVALSIITTTDGNYLISGSTSSKDGDITNQHIDPASTPEDAWVIKVNIDGNMIWHKCYGSTGRESAFSAYSTTDGGYIIVAHSEGNVINGDISNIKGALDAWVFKIDASGNIQWEKTYGGTNMDFGHHIEKGNDGGYLIAGYTYSIDWTSGTNGDTDGWLLKIDENGSLIWTKFFGTSNNERFTYISAVTNGYLVSGSVGSPMNSGTSWSDGWLLHISNNGTTQSEKKFGGNKSDLLGHVLPLSNGFYLLTGTTQSTDIGAKGGEDGYLVRSNE